MGGKDVIYIKQPHASNLPITEVQKMLKKEADERFSDVDWQFSMDSEVTSQRDKVRFFLHFNAIFTLLIGHIHLTVFIA